jgi:hypothetical protein
MERNLHETTSRWKTYGKRLFSEDLEGRDACQYNFKMFRIVNLEYSRIVKHCISYKVIMAHSRKSSNFKVLGNFILLATSIALSNLVNIQWCEIVDYNDEIYS